MISCASICLPLALLVVKGPAQPTERSVPAVPLSTYFFLFSFTRPYFSGFLFLPSLLLFFYFLSSSAFILLVTLLSYRISDYLTLRISYDSLHFMLIFLLKFSSLFFTVFFQVWRSRTPLLFCTICSFFRVLLLKATFSVCYKFWLDVHASHFFPTREGRRSEGK